MASLGRMTLMLAWSQAPEHIKGRNKRDSVPPGLATQMLALAKLPSMSTGGGLLYEEGGGSARLIADDCLKY
jgi:hypothetical protein